MKLNDSVIFQMIFQKLTLTYIQNQIKSEELISVINVIIVINFFLDQKSIRAILATFQEHLEWSNLINQNLISYQDNFRAKGDIPFVIYFDFETTAPTDNSFDPEQNKMFVFSYVMVVAFHLGLKLNRIVIQRSYAHSIEHLSSLNDYTQKQIS